MALAYLEIKDFPSEVSPILKGGSQVVAWYREGTLAQNERDAGLVALNAIAYLAGLGFDYFAHVTVGATSAEETVSKLQAAIDSASPSDEGVKAVNPILFFQIASLIVQLIKTLKS